MTSLLSDGVLGDVRACVAFGRTELGVHLEGLGAVVVGWEAAPGSASAEDDERADAAAASVGAGLDLLVVDAGARFAAFDGDDVARLRAAVDDSFVVVRAIAQACWIEPSVDGGKVVLLAPGTDAGGHSVACAAALENTARTLSVEWARFGIRVVAIAPRAGADAATVDELIAFIASPGGDYYSGCALRPGAVA